MKKYDAFMKIGCFSLFALMCVNVAFAAGIDLSSTVDPTPECAIYESPPDLNGPRDAKLQPPSKVSAAMADANGTASASNPNSNKYEVDGMTIELTQSIGCASGCWNIRQIMVTENGVSSYTSGDRSSLGNIYPEITLTIKGKSRTFVCDIPPGK